MNSLLAKKQNPLDKDKILLLYLPSTGDSPSPDVTLSDLHHKFKDSDGFLYLQYEVFTCLLDEPITSQ